MTTFAEAVTTTHQARAKVEVVDTYGTVVATLACTGGAVVSDRNAAHRRRLEGLTAVGVVPLPARPGRLRRHVPAVPGASHRVTSPA